MSNIIRERRIHKGSTFKKWTVSRGGAFVFHTGLMPTKWVNRLRTFSHDENEWKRNPEGGRYHPDEWTQFKKDIRKKGVKTPISIQLLHDGWGLPLRPLVGNGNHRRKAAKELGIRKVPVIMEYIRSLEDHIFHPRFRPRGPALEKIRRDSRGAAREFNPRLARVAAKKRKRNV